MFRSRFSAALVCAVLAGCAPSRPPPPTNLPPARPSTSIGPGDELSVAIVGEKELPNDYRVAPDGTIDFPYVGRLQVAGLEPQEIADRIRKGLIDNKILTDPQLTLSVKEYNSKYVSVIGQVGRPGSIKFLEGMKLVGAISDAGWFTQIADSNHVILTRIAGPKRVVTAIVSVDAITDGVQPDIPLQAGDTIKVEARVF